MEAAENAPSFPRLEGGPPPNWQPSLSSEIALTSSAKDAAQTAPVPAAEGPQSGDDGVHFLRTKKPPARDVMVRRMAEDPVVQRVIQRHASMMKKEAVQWEVARRRSTEEAARRASRGALDSKAVDFFSDVLLQCCHVESQLGE